ncbi:phospholipid-binding protein [Botrytis cinerea]
MAPATSRPRSPSQRPLPGSPTHSYASTLPLASTFSLAIPPPPVPHPPHAVLTKADLELSQIAYSELISTAKSYRLALAELSSSASAFGSALEACARLKEARSEALAPPGGSLSNSFTAKGNCTGDNLMSASGVHQLIANHQQILSECVYRSFELPLLHELDNWGRHIEEEEVSYRKEVKNKSKEIQKMEKEGLRLHKQRKRDVRGFRGHLVELTTRLDGLTTLHGEHSRALLRDCQDVSTKVVEASSSLVRAEVEIFEALARKGWTGGGLEDLLEHDSSGSPSKIFSILPQKSILVDATHPATDAPHKKVNHKRSDSLLVDNNHYQSLAAVADRDIDSGSIFSERDTRILNRSRGVRPFSPEPVERSLDPLEEEYSERSRFEAFGSVTPEIFKDETILDSQVPSPISSPEIFAETVTGTQAETSALLSADTREELAHETSSMHSEGTIRGDEPVSSSETESEQDEDRREREWNDRFYV